VSGLRTAPQGLSFETAHPAVEAFRELTDLLFPGEGLVRAAHEDGLPVMLDEDSALGSEAYRVNFSTRGAKVTASGPVGMLYGIITIAQVVRGARFRRQDFGFPTGGMIEDAPEKDFRG